jgi:hypothetical protein
MRSMLAGDFCAECASRACRHRQRAAEGADDGVGGRDRQVPPRVLWTMWVWYRVV